MLRANSPTLQMHPQTHSPNKTACSLMHAITESDSLGSRSNARSNFYAWKKVKMSPWQYSFGLPPNGTKNIL